MDGAGDCERDDDWGGPRDQADTFGTVGFLDVCAVEELLILDLESATAPSMQWHTHECHSFWSTFVFGAGVVVVENDLPAGVEAAGNAKSWKENSDAERAIRLQTSPVGEDGDNQT